MMPCDTVLAMMIIMIFIFEREKEIKCIYLTQHYGYYSGIDI